MQSQGALAGRLRSFSMQDLRSLREQSPVHFQDPLYLEEQESLPQPLGEELGGVTARGGSSKAHSGRAGSWRVPLSPGYVTSRHYESETDDEELWSDLQVSPPLSPRRDPKPLSRSQSLRCLRKNPAKEVPWEGSTWGRVWGCVRGS